MQEELTKCFIKTYTKTDFRRRKSYISMTKEFTIATITVFSILLTCRVGSGRAFLRTIIVKAVIVMVTITVGLIANRGRTNANIVNRRWQLDGVWTYAHSTSALMRFTQGAKVVCEFILSVVVIIVSMSAWMVILVGLFEGVGILLKHLATFLRLQHLTSIVVMSKPYTYNIHIQRF